MIEQNTLRIKSWIEFGLAIVVLNETFDENKKMKNWIKTGYALFDWKWPTLKTSCITILNCKILNLAYVPSFQVAKGLKLNMN